jgi:DNA-binding protein YbaB
MTAPMFNELEKAQAELEERRAALAGVEEKLSGLSVTITAKNRAVAVTADSRGAVTGIRFPTAAFRRMAPAELATLLVETIEEARSSAVAQTIARFRDEIPGASPFLERLGSVIGAGGPSRLEDLIEEVVNDARPAGEDA